MDNQSVDSSLTLDEGKLQGFGPQLVPEEKQRMLDAERDEIEAGREVEAFLKSGVVRGCFRALEQQYMGALLEAKEPGIERDTAWAKARALRDLAVELRGVVRHAEVTARVRQNREAQEARTTKQGRATR